MKKQYALFLMLVGLLFSTIAQATSYKINLIVFKYTSPNTSAENWATVPTIPSFMNAISIGQSNPIEQDEISPLYTLLSEREAGLQFEASRLKMQTDRAYTILLHTAWIQPIGPISQTGKWVHVIAGKVYNDINAYEFNGFIRFSKNGFFNVDSKLYLTEPKSLLNINSDSNYIIVPIEDHRHTKINEINYIDHPLLGMLIQITPG